MAYNFDIGGEQDFIFRRHLNASGEYIPVPLAADIAVADSGGAADAVLTALANQLESTNGFYSQENIPVSICFNGKGSSVVELQVYNPLSVGAATLGVGWQTWIPNAEWVNGKALTFLAPQLPWRVGCVTLDGGDTALNVTVVFMRACYNRHA